MSLQIIYGLPGSGKSEYLRDIAEHIWKQTDKKVFFIVPEHYSYETEKAMATRLGVISPKTVEVLSFKRLFYYVCNNIGGGLLPKLTDTGKNILLSKSVKNCLDNLTVLSKSARYEGFTEILSTLFSEFKRYNTTPEVLKNHILKLENNVFLKSKLEDIALLYETFENEINGVFSDPDDALTLLSKILQINMDFFKDSIFLIDEFEGFTPQELSVIGEISRQADEVKITLCTDDLLGEKNLSSIFGMQIQTVENMTLLCDKYNITALKPIFIENKKDIWDKSKVILEKNLRLGKNEVYTDVPEYCNILYALNLTGEIEQIAEIITKKVRDEGYRYKDFTVVATDIEKYKDICSNVFLRYDIPVYISESSLLGDETPAFAILGIFNIILNKWDYDSVFSFLKTGFSCLTDTEVDILENYILKTGIRGSGWTNGKPWKYTPSGVSEQDLEEIETIRNKFTEPLICFENCIKEKCTVRDFIRATVVLMQAFGFSDKINNICNKTGFVNSDISAKYKQIYNSIITVFDEIEQVSLPESHISAEEFYSMLLGAFNAHKVGIIPTSLDSVCITDVQRARAGKSKQMFIVGVNDGAFPKIYKTEGIIKDEEREILSILGLKMAPDTLSRIYDEDFICYSTLLAAKEKVYLSYPLADNKGGVLMPSLLIRKIKLMFTNINETENFINNDWSLDSVSAPEPTLYKLAQAKSRAREGEEVSSVWNEIEKWFAEDKKNKEKYEMINKALVYNNTSKEISKENLSEIYKNVVYTSVSKLESFKKCPFMYFSKYILGAKTRGTTEIKSVDTGSFMHSVIEKLSIMVGNTFGSWKDVDDSFICSSVDKIVDDEIKELEKSIDFLQPKSLWSFYRMKEALKSSAIVIARQLNSGEFIPMGYEISFSDDGEYKCIEFDVGNKKIKLQGKVDRSDIYTDDNGRKFIRVIDYKSGNREFRIQDLYYGLNLQLAVYLDSLTTQENAVCAGMLYFRLYDPIVKTDGDIEKNLAVEKCESERSFSGLLLSDKEILEKMDENIYLGKTYLPVKFNKNGSFSSNSKIADYEQFKAMNLYLRTTVKQMTAQMLSGKTDISPVKVKDTAPCTYCDYRQMCHFDISCGNDYNRIYEKKADEIWEEIMKGEKQDA